MSYAKRPIKVSGRKDRKKDNAIQSNRMLLNSVISFPRGDKGYPAYLRVFYDGKVFSNNIINGVVLLEATFVGKSFKMSLSLSGIN